MRVSGVKDESSKSNGEGEQIDHFWGGRSEHKQVVRPIKAIEDELELRNDLFTVFFIFHSRDQKNGIVIENGGVLIVRMNQLLEKLREELTE